MLVRGWSLKKIHELDALLDEAIEHEPELASFKELCERVSGYYFSERYPTLDHTELTCEEVKNDLEEAQKLVDILSSK